MSKPKRKIVYVLTVLRYFPGTHPRKGQETGFPDKIISGDKQHTVLGNYALWKKRADKINAGLAVLSIRFWTGKPYASKQYAFCELSTINVQKVHVYQIARTHYDSCMALSGILPTKTDILIEDRLIPLKHPFKFAAHDGLSLQDFNAWFKKPGEDMACIHFKNFAY